MSNSRSCRFSFRSEIYYSACRTFLCAESAVLALLRIYHGQIVFNLDSVKLASFFALLAAYTSVGAGFSRLCARIGRMTLHYDLILGRSYSDNVVRAGISTYTASHAHISVYYSYAVAYLDSAIRARSLTISKTQTSVGAHIEPAEQLLGSCTG